MLGASRSWVVCSSWAGGPTSSAPLGIQSQTAPHSALESVENRFVALNKELSILLQRCMIFFLKWCCLCCWLDWWSCYGKWLFWYSFFFFTEISMVHCCPHSWTWPNYHSSKHCRLSLICLFLPFSSNSLFFVTENWTLAKYLLCLRHLLEQTYSKCCDLGFSIYHCFLSDFFEKTQFILSQKISSVWRHSPCFFFISYLFSFHSKKRNVENNIIESLPAISSNTLLKELYF